ncbi:RNA12 protein-domain-containing protein [Cantharellus anzutake]|uniref:RNA12 protein-domain-containing protein n=1 Tax=Cantharellus anzutake TaxID=1750568 RepID=UPI001903D59F|nr:RNA12 protein-domain-containing protein [Cantharellus anzutake]KAF8337623.1 RNA12 protein-domain-containing protein [Cantharellus anzutake]
MQHLLLHQRGIQVPVWLARQPRLRGDLLVHRSVINTVRRRARHDMAPNSPQRLTASLYIDSVFPVRFGKWDIRYLFATLRQPAIMDRLAAIFKDIDVHGFKLLNLELPRSKDGGVFAEFQYTAPDPEEIPYSLAEIQEVLRKSARDHGGVPSWSGLRQGDIWLVKGKPWKEDLDRFPSSQLRIEFEGADVHTEVLYEALRPYGPLVDITRPSPVPAGAPHFANAVFYQVRSAVRAQNCLHGIVIYASDTAKTRLGLVFEKTVKVSAVRDWLASHPRIVLPVLAFVLGMLTYTVFDPLRTFMVEVKVWEIFEYPSNKLTEWLRKNIFGRVPVDLGEYQSLAIPGGTWEERKEAQVAISTYLSDQPATILFLHGPAGSGKWNLVSRILRTHKRPHLVLDCKTVLAQDSDTSVMAQIAKQTGYWPLFGFLGYLNNIVDLVSVGLIGQKAGFSSPLDQQLMDLLKTVVTALKRVNHKHILEHERKLRKEVMQDEREKQDKRVRDIIRHGLWHDGRLDCIAGNGIIGELGLGDELFRAEDDVPEDIGDGEKQAVEVSARKSDFHDLVTKQERWPKAWQEAEFSGVPIVIVKNFGSKGGTGTRDIVLDVFSKWATQLVEGHIAHVIVVSDNKENVKRLTKSLGARPLTAVSLEDADTMTALQFVTAHSSNAELMQRLTLEKLSYIERLGGRVSDLDALVYKIQNGMSVEAAVEDIIERTTSEVRRNTFGDDMDDVKGLAWQREQAWAVVSKLASQDEIPYLDTLLDFPFKGDDVPIREMERAELIHVVTRQGVPISIRAGRPVYRYVFQRLMNDPIFHALQEIGFNEKRIALAESNVRACEEELIKLKSIGLDLTESYWGTPSVSLRVKYLAQKMRSSAQKIILLEEKNAKLRKVLTKYPRS